MKFTVQDLPPFSDSLISFIRRTDLKEADVCKNGYLYGIYDKEKVINKLEQHVSINENISKYKKYKSLWENNLNILKSLS